MKEYPKEENYLLIIFSEKFPTWGLVDGLSNSNDLAIAVADRHAQEGLGFVARQLVNFVTESAILQARAQQIHKDTLLVISRHSSIGLFRWQVPQEVRLLMQHCELKQYVKKSHCTLQRYSHSLNLFTFSCYNWKLKCFSWRGFSFTDQYKPVDCCEVERNCRIMFKMYICKVYI